MGEESGRCGGEVTEGWNESGLVGHEREFVVPSELNGTWLDSFKKRSHVICFNGISLAAAWKTDCEETIVDGGRHVVGGPL